MTTHDVGQTPPKKDDRKHMFILKFMILTLRPYSVDSIGFLFRDGGFTKALVRANSLLALTLNAVACV